MTEDMEVMETIPMAVVEDMVEVVEHMEVEAITVVVAVVDTESTEATTETIMIEIVDHQEVGDEAGAVKFGPTVTTTTKTITAMMPSRAGAEMMVATKREVTMVEPVVERHMMEATKEVASARDRTSDLKQLLKQ